MKRSDVRTVRATTPSWLMASLRVMVKLGMTLAETRDHDMFGELLVFSVKKAPANAGRVLAPSGL